MLVAGIQSAPANPNAKKIARTGMPTGNFWLFGLFLPALFIPFSLNPQQGAAAASQAANPPAAQSGAPSTQQSGGLIGVNKNLKPEDAAWTLLTEGVASTKVRDRSDAISALTVLDT